MSDSLAKAKSMEVALRRRLLEQLIVWASEGLVTNFSDDDVGRSASGNIKLSASVWFNHTDSTIQGRLRLAVLHFGETVADELGTPLAHARLTDRMTVPPNFLQI